MKRISPALCALLLVTASCTTTDPVGYGEEPTRNTYSEAHFSNLKTIAPYPTDNDVCETVASTRTVEALVRDGYILIACPKHEKGAISDRLLEGAQVIAQARHWTILEKKVQ